MLKYCKLCITFTFYSSLIFFFIKFQCRKFQCGNIIKIISIAKRVERNDWIRIKFVKEIYFFNFICNVHFKKTNKKKSKTKIFLVSNLKKSQIMTSKITKAGKK